MGKQNIDLDVRPYNMIIFDVKRWESRSLRLNNLPCNILLDLLSKAHKEKEMQHVLDYMGNDVDIVIYNSLFTTYIFIIGIEME